MNRSSFSRGDVQLAVAATGAGADFVFQHGLCGDAAQTMDVAPRIEGWRTVTLECRGHGGSEAGDASDLSLGTFAADLIAFIEQRCSAPVALGGISMGAALATMVAVKRPDLVRALVIARPAWMTDPAPPNLAPYVEVGDFLARLTPSEAVAAFATSPTLALVGAKAPDNLKSLRGFLTREPIAVTKELLTRIARDGPGLSLSAIAGIKTPALVLGNGQDFAHPFALAERFAATLPGARFVPLTPKSVDGEAYRNEFRAALEAFLTALPR
jgi:pimeloyl-ACP methyl ester carboxylesterase